MDEVVVEVRASDGLPAVMRSLRGMLCDTRLGTEEDRQAGGDLLAIVNRDYGSETLHSVVEMLRRWRVNASVTDAQMGDVVRLTNWLCRRMNVPLRLRQSGLAQGWGVFAAHDIEPRTYLTTYGGTHVPRAKAPQYNRDDPRTHYTLVPEEDEDDDEAFAFDGYRGFKLLELGRWCNTQPTEEECNADFVQEGSGPNVIIRVQARKAIRKNEEVFVWYSEDYARRLFGRARTKKPRTVETCIQCQMRPATCRFRHDRKLKFCNSECATVFWLLK